jgi:hypothetical protein
LGVYLFWANFLITKVAHIFGLLFYTVRVMYHINIDKTGVGLHFGRLFLQAHPVTLGASESFFVPHSEESKTAEQLLRQLGKRSAARAAAAVKIFCGGKNSVHVRPWRGWGVNWLLTKQRIETNYPSSSSLP